MVEHQRAFAQMAPGELPLDPSLPRAQPVQCGLDLALLDDAHFEYPAQAQGCGLRSQSSQG